ncbi:MAG: MFS transporter [Chloroflexota bacterium]
MPLFVLAHFSHHLIAALLQPLLPLIRDDFKLDYAQAGWVVSAFTLAYGFSQLPAGWLADRIGARLLITIGISGVAVAGLLAGLSPSYTIMVIFLVGMGILGGGYHPAASPLVSASVEEKKRGRALGLHQIGGTASFFLTPLIAVGIATALGTWRSSFIILAILTFIFGIIFYVMLGRRGNSSKAENGIQDNQAAAALIPGRLSSLIPFIVIGVAIQVTVFSTISFIPLFAVDQLKTSENVGAALLAVAQFAGLWAGPLGGYLADRIGKVPVMLAVALATGPAIYLLNMVSIGWSIYAILLVMGVCQYVGMPVSEAYIISHSPQRNRSTILGFYYFASRGGPGLLMPVMGYLIDRFSFGTAFTIVGSGMLVVALGCSLWFWRNRD